MAWKPFRVKHSGLDMYVSKSAQKIKIKNNRGNGAKWSLPPRALWVMIFKATITGFGNAKKRLWAQGSGLGFPVQCGIVGARKIRPRQRYMDWQSGSLGVCKINCSVTSPLGSFNNNNKKKPCQWRHLKLGEGALWFLHPLCREVLLNPATVLANPWLPGSEQTLLRHSFLIPLHSG